MLRKGSVFVLLMLVSTLAESLGPDTQGGTVLPIWTKDLNEFSYHLRPSPQYIGGNIYILGRAADIGVLFASSDQVICYYVTKTAGLAQRNKPGTSDTFHIHLLALDAQTAAVRYQKDLPTRARGSSVMAGARGNLIIRTGELLRSYSSTLQVISERPLPVTSEYQDWDLRLSPSRRTLLLDRYGTTRNYIEVVDGYSLTTITTWENGTLFPLYSVSDINVARPNARGRGIISQQFGGAWSTVANTQLLPCANPQFVTDQKLVNACGHDIEILGVDGSVVMRDKLEGKGENFEEAPGSVSPDGRYYAVSAMTTKGGKYFDTAIRRDQTRVLVYDLNAKQRIFSVWLPARPERDYDYAISPDGSKLAVMIDNFLRVYRIR